MLRNVFSTRQRPEKRRGRAIEESSKSGMMPDILYSVILVMRQDAADVLGRRSDDPSVPSAPLGSWVHPGYSGRSPGGHGRTPQPRQRQPRR